MERRPPIPVVMGYVKNEKERARLAGALRGWARADWADSAEALLATVRRMRAGPLTVLVGPRDGAGRRTAPVVADLVRTVPRAAVVACCRTGVEHAADIRAMAAAGVHEFLFAGVDDQGPALRSVLTSAQRVCAAANVLAVMRPLLPEGLHALVEQCVTHPAKARTVTAVAASMGVNRKTLRNHCARARLPGPAELIVWCRLMMAAQLLWATGQTVEWAALELEFPSATALRNTMKRYTGLRAVEIVRAGGVRGVLAAYRRRVERVRRPARRKAGRR